MLFTLGCRLFIFIESYNLFVKIHNVKALLSVNVEDRTRDTKLLNCRPILK